MEGGSVRCGCHQLRRGERERESGDPATERAIYDGFDESAIAARGAGGLAEIMGWEPFLDSFFDGCIVGSGTYLSDIPWPTNTGKLV